MKGKHPKRRKAKDNPCRYFLSFKDGKGELQEFEITKTLYDIFNRFELDDLVYLNVWDMQKRLSRQMYMVTRRKS